MTKQRAIYIVAAIVLILLVASTTATMSWFLRSSETGAHMQMGKVSINVLDTEFDLGALSQKQLIKGQSLVITNESTAASYIRIGYTFTFQDENGDDVAFDMRDGFAGVTLQFLTVGNKSQKGFVSDAGVQYDIGGYKKNFVELLESTESGSKYLLIAPGESIECSMTFHYNFGVYSAEEIAEIPTSLSVSLIPEAIQATHNAVASASDYGWNISKVGEQAAGVSNR